jgi:type I restriction enzyme, S subunit
LNDQIVKANFDNTGQQPNISTIVIMNFEIILPSVKKSKPKIVHHIQTETQRIYTTISKIEKEIELMNEYRTALMSEVVTGKVKVTE